MKIVLGCYCEQAAETRAVITRPATSQAARASQELPLGWRRKGGKDEAPTSFPGLLGLWPAARSFEKRHPRFSRSFRAKFPYK